MLTGCQDRAVPKAAEPASVQPVVQAPSDKSDSAAGAALPDDEAQQIAALDAATRRIAAAACEPEEETIFYCKIAKGKPLSVCATKQGKGEYRYGGQRRELVLQEGSWSVDSYARGGESQIRFVNGDTIYTVFSRMVSTSVEEHGSGPAISDGVVIESSGKPAQLRLCEGKQAEIPVKHSAARRVFGEPEDLFTGLTSEADTIE
ncbi:MAG: hypothetical protein NWP98_01830 [Erythrobacter sp.]|nr:hypothetical protein [Erythrobacter sp.]